MSDERQEFAVADFETTTDPNDCRVWSWCVSHGRNPEATIDGTDLESFMLYIEQLAEEGILLYFHNLAFDGSFIIDYLMRHGYSVVSPDPTERPKEHEFSCLMSKKGKLYSIEIGLATGAITIQDSLKLLPMSVRAIGKAFDLGVTKGEIDYTAYRPVGYQPTQEEWDYIHRDVIIVAKALNIGYDMGLSKMTIGANCFAEYKQIIGTKAYKNYFPAIDLEVDGAIRRAYRGGFTYVNPKYAGVDIANGISVDYNSMYPSMMLLRDYPVGKPIAFEGRYKPSKRYPLYVQTLTCEFKLKPGHVPTIQLRNRGFYGEHEYVERSLQTETVTLTSIDLALFLENYDVDVYSWDGGFMFRSMPGEKLFGEYINKWGNIKRTSKGGRRQWAKLYLNNLYGKFSTNPDVTGKYPVFDYEKNKVRWEIGDLETRDPVYLPVGAFCTAYARDALIRAIQANYDRFVYCDTDSMHLIGDDDPEGIPLHDSDFGAWKVEGRFTHARHLRAKCYIWDLNGKIGVTCAGMPQNIKDICTFDNFHFGFTNMRDGKIIEGAGKLIPRTVPGGVVLEERSYQLKE